VILYVLLAGFLPFDEPHMSQLFRKIQKADFTYPSWFGAPVRQMLDRILVADPTRRLGIKEIEEDAWFLGPDMYHDDNDSGVDAAAAAEGGAGISGAGAAAGGAGGRTLPHVPSEKDVEEAVAEVGDELSGLGPGEAAAAAAAAGAAAAAPPVLNAFEVRQCCGAPCVERCARARAPHCSTLPPPRPAAPPPCSSSTCSAAWRSTS